MLLAAGVLVVAALAGVGRAKENSCKLNLQQDLDSTKEPLILEVTDIQKNVEQLEIIRPEVEGNDGVIYVGEDKSFLVACTGHNNYLEGSHSQSAYTKCHNGKLEINGGEASKERLSCSKHVAEPSVKLSDDLCGEGDDSGTVVQLGFELADRSPKVWFPLVDICYNRSRSVTFYSHHALYGGSLKGAVKSSQRTNYLQGPKLLFMDVNPYFVYVRAEQTKVFDKILGNGGSKRYLSKTQYLVRGHLSPDADFIYRSGQQMTYYYVNVAPQWMTFNTGNWLNIENEVRDLAVKEDETLNVWTGTYGILKLKNADGEERMMYLDPTKKLIPVPEVYWKLVQHPVKKSCTVAVGHNNVFLTEPPNSICKEAKPDGWPKLTNLDKGYVYYCDYESFKETVTFAPKLDCKDLFEFPQQKTTQ